MYRKNFRLPTADVEKMKIHLHMDQKHFQLPTEQVEKIKIKSRIFLPKGILGKFRSIFLDLRVEG